jgi:hypothetical protein
LFFNTIFSGNRAVYEKMWGKCGTAELSADDSIIWRMRSSLWITKATDSHSEYVILISFPRQQWLPERASTLLVYAHCVSVPQFHNTYTETDLDVSV